MLRIFYIFFFQEIEFENFERDMDGFIARHGLIAEEIRYIKNEICEKKMLK